MKNEIRINIDLIMGRGLKRWIGYLATLSIVCLAMPLFINLKDFSFFLRNTNSEGYLNGGMGGIPFPFFGFLIILIFFTLILSNYRRMIKQLSIYDFFLLSLSLLFIIMSAVSHYSLIAVIQLLMFPVLLWLVSFFTIQGRLGRYYLFGLVFFACLHLLSIISMNGWTLLHPFLRYIVYESLFYYQIYQGLISYVNVLTIGGVLLLYFLFRQKELWSSVLIGFSLILVIYVAALSSQRSFALDLIVISLLVVFIVIVRNTISVCSKCTALSAILLLWILSVFAVNNDSGDTAIGRLAKTFDRMNDVSASISRGVSGEQEGLANGLERVSHAFETMDRLKTTMEGDKFSVLFKGTGNVHSGSHNFILDMVSGAGVIGALFYFMFALGAAWRLVGPVMKTKKAVPVAFIVAMSLMMFLGSMVNSPMTQPYYFLNFIFIAWIIVSDSVEQDRGSSK